MARMKGEAGTSKILIGVVALIVILVLLGGVYYVFVYKPALQEKEQFNQRLAEFGAQYQDKRAQGYDVSEAGVFAKKARQAFNKKDYKTANTFLDDAFAALDRAMKVPGIPEDVKAAAKARLAQVKIASLYERVTDGALIGRSTADVVTIFEETDTDFIFRGWWRFNPCPESSTDSSGFFTSAQLAEAAERGYTYGQLRTTIPEIKAAVPDVIFCGAMGAQYMNARERNPITGEILDRDETWEMALDPEKWGIAQSKSEFQEGFAKNHNWVASDETYDQDKVAFYYPDLTNPDFQDLFLSWAKKQIDCGADAIWIDFLFTQANILETKTGDPNHPAVKESYDAAYVIVDEIHNYGYSKYGKYVYVGTWSGVTRLPYSQQDLDFVTMTPSPNEILSENLDEGTWESTTAEISQKLGDIPVFAFIDWAGDGAPISVFSQNLDRDQQRAFLNTMADYFQSRGIIFVYPIHGGFLGDNAKILAFGEYKVYDSLAPEFSTYDAIKEVVQK